MSTGPSDPGSAPRTAGRGLFALALAIAVAAGAWLRLDQLAFQVLAEDEWHPVHQVIHSSARRVLTSFGNADYSIPLTLIDFIAHRLFGLSETILRLPSVLAGIATVALVPLAVRRQVGIPTASLLALALAASPFLVSYSRIARSYALTLLGVYLAFWCLERATRGGAIEWPGARLYGLLCGVVVWTHAITGPLLVAPLLFLVVQSLRGRGPAFRDVVLLALLTGAWMALAVVPPLLGDPQALAGKSGLDTIGGDTLVGAWHLWLGTGSAVAAWAGLGLFLVGAHRVWTESVLARWVIGGSLLTIAILLVTKPWWVDRPLAFARYLLPLLPVILLGIARGLVLVVEAASRQAGLRPGATGIASIVAGALVFAAWLPTTPIAGTLHRPNSYSQHAWFQYDYRTERNPVRRGLAGFPASGFWDTLAGEPPGSLTIAVAPFQYSTYEWPGPLWEMQSRQRVIPAYLWGTCVARRYGEVPPGEGFRFANAIFLRDPWSSPYRRVDFVAYYKGPRWENVSPPLPACEAWARERFGPPFHEDEALVVWKRPDEPGIPARQSR